mgnify:CR=1 FL=1
MKTRCVALHPLLSACRAQSANRDLRIPNGMVDGNANASNWWNCARHLELEPCNGHARPHLLFFADTDNILLKSINFKNSPDWSLHFSSCNNLHINEISVNNPKDAHNSDGIDVDCTTNVIIENSYFSVGDDAIAIKSGIDYFGRRFNKSSRNIIYRNNIIEQGHGLSIGSETSGSIYNVTFENLIFAFNICRFVKSNAIVLTNENSTVGIGAGQPSRLDSCDVAIRKMKKFQNISNKEILAASDAFFPFVDGIEKLVQNGVSGIIQPSGSIRDKEIINFANKTGTILVFSKSRHFKH